MILYFADRQLNIIGQASTGLPSGLTVIDDLLTEDVETGVATFECKVPYDKKTRAKVEACTEVGNYLLLDDSGESKLFTIIDAEIDTKSQEVYIYAEDGGMDLLNEICGEYEADKAYPISHYINKYASNAGFSIGINEAASLTRQLSWDGESTAAERIASVATQFDGCEVSYSFAVNGLTVTKKYINIYKKRGKDIGTTLLINRDIDKIVTTKSIANLATALLCTGGTPDNEEEPITLDGYSYDDGDFYTDGAYLKSREALKRWNRYLWKNEQSEQIGGHIVKLYNYDTTEKSTLCAHAITELKKIRDIAVNYTADIKKMPENIRVGDRVNIVDDDGELYLSTRFLKLETSRANQTCEATLGEFLIKTSGISQTVADLASSFAANAKTAARATAAAQSALNAATSANTSAQNAQTTADAAAAAAAQAQAEIEELRNQIEGSAEATALMEESVNDVEVSVAALESTLDIAMTAADNAQIAADTAQAKADEAAAAAAQAQADAAAASEAVTVVETKAVEAKTLAVAAQDTADSAVSQANTAQATAEAAKLDAETANSDIAALSEDVETLSTTMSVNYARKTDLTEATATLQSQIEQNATEITSTVTKIAEVDETANNAQEQAAAAQAVANAAQAQADNAQSAAESAQTAANNAQAAADNAQSEADAAKAAAAAAKGVADKAETDLAAAKADLATVSSRVDATEEDIIAAQALVEAAQEAADKAKADASAAATKAQEAQTKANTAATDAANAQTVANDAASKATNAQKLADEAKGNASAAVATANQAAAVAAEAQTSANAAKTTADNAQAIADQAVADAAAAQTAADDAGERADAAAADLETAKQNLANVVSRVDATESEVEAAQTAVATAQAAADSANADAAAAQATADTAKANAAKAQTAANNAKTAADAAQTAADEAQQAADDAQAAVDALTVRVTSAETNITQNTEQIALRAKKTEVTETLGGYYTKEQADAAIQVSADAIKSEVSEGINSAQNTADDALSSISAAETIIRQLADSIATLVRDGNGGSLIKQDADGIYYFDISEIEANQSNTANEVNDISGLVRDISGQIDVLNSTAEALRSRTEYVRSYVDENDQPCLELGEGDSTFKVYITNTEIRFADGSTVPAKINRQMLMIERAMVKDELQFGDDEEVSGVWIWKRRSNGNLGLMWKEVSG